MTTDCVFCQIFTGKAPASVVLESDLVVQLDGCSKRGELDAVAEQIRRTVENPGA